MFIKWLKTEENIIYLSSETANDFGIKQEPMMFQFGSWTRYVQVHIRGDLREDEIGLPELWQTYFTIPDTLPYELVKTDRTLKLGPVIALIVFSRLEEMTLSKMEYYRDYFSDYDSINGLVYLCAWDQIDMTKKQIRGYYFNPDARIASKRWKLGIFPYPNAAYNRTAMPESMFNALLTVMGDRIFNSFSDGSFNKWELWKRLSPEAELHAHIPATKSLTDVESLNSMLEEHGVIYLKPAGGTLSRGIRKMERKGEGYLVTYPLYRNGEGNSEVELACDKEVARWIDKLPSKEYIIQQAISMKRHDGRPIDFRVIMQKDECNEWNCSGVFGKFGRKGNIITNFTQAGCIHSGLDTFRTAFGMSNEDAQAKLDELKEIALRICHVFDNYGNYGDLGIDLMIDEDGMVWVLEANTLDTYHRFPLRVDNDQTLFKQIVTSPFRYSKFLAGFSSK